MTATGRLEESPDPEAQRLLARRAADEPHDVLRRQVRMDRAHVIACIRSRAICAADGHRILRAIESLEAEDFAPVLARPRDRGLYLAVEAELCERTEAATAMHVARSRNDMMATDVRLALREPWMEAGDELAALLVVLQAAVARYGDTIFPISTNAQPAAPVTLGHVLAGVALAIGRDLEAWAAAGAALQRRCPLGAGAVSGSSIDAGSELAAELLGFELVLVNSVDAVAARDEHLQLAAVGVSVTATLARVARLLLDALNPVLGMLRLSGALCGSSSVLPHKRNPHLLERVIADGAGTLGMYSAAAGIVASAPFTNSAAINGDLPGVLAPIFASVTRSAGLTRLIVDGLEVDRERMLDVADRGFTTAAYVAEQLVAGGVPLRVAHHAVGRLVTELERAGRTLKDVTEVPGFPGITVDPSPVAAVSATASMGGPTAASRSAALEDTDAAIETWGGVRDKHAARWEQADVALMRAVASSIDDTRQRSDEGGS